MQRKQQKEDPDFEVRCNVARATTIGHQTEDHNKIEYLIGELVLQNNLKMASFVTACQKHPQLKEQTKLIHEIFLKPEFVQDLIRFLMTPFKVLTKYGLSFDEGRGYVSTIRQFLYENYEFYEFYFLALEKEDLTLDPWFQFLEDNKSQTFYSSLGNLTDIFNPFIKYEYSTSSRITEYFQKNDNQKSILVINLIPDALLERMLTFTQYEAIFRVIFNVVLVSLQEQEWKHSLNLLKSLCLSGIGQEATLDTHIENIYLMVKDVSNNIEKDKHNTIFAFIDAFVQTNLVKAALNRTTDVLQNSPALKNTGTYSPEEESSLEFNLKMLTQIINIYHLLRNNGIDSSAGQMVKLSQNILQICHFFDRIIKPIRTVQSKSLNFSNGENVRSICIYRYDFLNLLKTSLLLIKEHGETCPQFQLNIDKSQILELLIRCLSENRWNSIVHCLIEKIVCLMINTEFFKARNNSIRKFLSFIVQAFNNKKYMFLNSTKMINQGDIYSLYFIARKITAELDRMPAIVDSTNQYDFWKKFVLNVLQKYEDSTERLSTKVSEFQDEFNDKYDKDQDLKVEIDEVALIKEIVKKIEINKKWNFKRESHSTICRIGSASELNKKLSIKSEKLGTPGNHSKFRNSINQDKIKQFTQQMKDNKGLASFKCFKGHSSQEEIKMENSNHSSEQVLAFSHQNSHSDTQMVDSNSKSDNDQLSNK